MQRYSTILLPSLALINCTDSGQKDRDDAAYYCANFSEGVCGVIMNQCTTEQDAEWCDNGDNDGYDEVCYEQMNEWADYCALEVQQDCIDYFLKADDQEAFRDVIDLVCWQGFSEDRRDEVFPGMECEDLADPENYYDPQYPYLEMCPCIESLEYYQNEETSIYYCGSRG